MKLFGYTVGQMLVIGLIAIFVLFLFKELDARVQIPGLHRVISTD